MTHSDFLRPFHFRQYLTKTTLGLKQDRNKGWTIRKRIGGGGRRTTNEIFDEGKIKFKKFMHAK